MKSQQTKQTEEAYQETITGESPVLDEELLIKKSEHGHKTLINELPQPESSSDHKIRETESGDGRQSHIDYPRNQTHCTVHRYRHSKNYSKSFHVSTIKKFNITIDRDEHEEAAERIETVINNLSQISTLKEQINNISTFEELVQNADLIRAYDTYYSLLQDIFHKDSIASHVTGETHQTPRKFEIGQFPQGFYGIPHLYNSHANKIINGELKEKNLGKDSTAWGVFIIDPEDFSEIHNLLQPFYHTPD